MASDSVSMQYQFAQLAALCRKHPVAPKVVFVPTLQIGHNLGTSLARLGVSWANLHVTTPLRWAQRLAEPSLEATGRRLVSQDADYFFMQQMLRQTDWPEGHPFAAGYSFGQLAETFLQTIRALRLAGVDAEELAQSGIAFGDRRIFTDLYRSYEEWLVKQGLYDQADIYREAVRPVPEEDLVVAVFDETPLSELAFRFVRSLSASPVRIGRSEAYGLPAPQQSACERFADCPVVPGKEGTVGTAGKIYLGALDTEMGDGVALREATGVENEVRGVLRELLRRGAKVDEIEFVYASEDPYLPLIADVLGGLEIPVLYASGVPGPLTRVGQSLIGFYEWLASDYDPDKLVSLLRSRLLLAGEGIAFPAIVEIIQEAGMGRGHASWKHSLEQLQIRFAKEEGKQKLVTHATTWFERLYETVPRGETVSLGGAAAAGLRFLEGGLAPVMETDRDRKAASSLGNRLRGMGNDLDTVTGISASGPLSDIARSITDLLAGHKTQAATARPGHLYVAPVERAGYTGRKYTVVVGLSEATFPGAALEDPILLDDERDSVSGGRLPKRRECASEAVWNLVRLLGMAGSHILLTANRRDMVEGREVYPAPLFELLKQQLEQERPPVLRIVPAPGDALTPAEVAMALRDCSSTREDVQKRHPALRRGLQAVRARAAKEIGVYDGWLGRPMPALHPCADDTKALSASRLETLTACPYKYFLRYVLAVHPPEVRDPGAGHWLTPLEFGSLLHEVLEKFMTTLAERGERVDPARHTRLLVEDIMERAVSRFQEQIPVLEKAGFDTDMRRLKQSLRIFLNEESQRDVRPAGFEVSFGFRESGGLSAPEPVMLRLSEDVQFRLRGKIDRVDEVAGGYEAWDYKSGSSSNYNEQNLLAEARRLQWALYAFVLDELLMRKDITGHATRSGYFFPNERAHGLRVGQSPPSREAVAKVLAPFFDMAGQGAFLHVQKYDACAWCDYKTVCGSERKEKQGVLEALGARYVQSAGGQGSVTEGAHTLAEAMKGDDLLPPFFSALEAWVEV